MIAAYVDGRPLFVAEVHDRLAAMRRGPAAALLPIATTAEGRQLVRWLTQVAVTERVLTDEAARRGLAVGGPPWPLDATSRVHLGGALSAVLVSSPTAVAAAHDVTAHVQESAEHDQVSARSAQARRLRWVTSCAAGRDDNGGRPWLIDVQSLPTELRDALSTAACGDEIRGTTTTYVLGGWTQRAASTVSVYGAATAARNLALVRWVDRQLADVVRLQRGFEHPGDIGQPDHTHHH